MAIVRIPTPLRPHAGGLDRMEAAGTTVGEVLGQVTSLHPALRERLFKGDELQDYVRIYLNNEDIRYLEDLETPVGPTDDVSIIPAIAGG